MDIETKNMKVAWGITGSGDDIKRILDTVKRVKERYEQVDIRVYVSKSGEQVLRMYLLWDELMSSFSRVQVEKSPNTPFLAGELQFGKYDFFIIAPTTSNTTAKMALGLGDSMISNAVNMATKAGVPVYILPCDIGEASTETVLPDGKVLKLRIRKIDSDHIKSLEALETVHVLRDAQEIIEVFEDNYH